MSDYSNPNGIEILMSALNYHMGDVGDIFLIFMLVAFSFSTIISAYYYGESGFKYLFPSVKEKYLILLKIMLFGVIVLSSIISPTYIWDTVDVGTALLSIINVYALFKLRKVMIEEYHSK
jgi:AGCS family alanine or glycine:cation symporter